MGGAAAGIGVAGAVIEGVALVGFACGVLATVESPEPQPVSGAAINAATARPVNGSGIDHTSRTVPSSGAQMRVTRRADPPRPAPLRLRSPLGLMVVTRRAQLRCACDHH